jgi:hypothetical protein
LNNKSVLEIVQMTFPKHCEYNTTDL